METAGLCMGLALSALEFHGDGLRIICIRLLSWLRLFAPRLSGARRHQGLHIFPLGSPRLSGLRKNPAIFARGRQNLPTGFSLSGKRTSNKAGLGTHPEEERAPATHGAATLSFDTLRSVSSGFHSNIVWDASPIVPPQPPKAAGPG